MESAPHQPIKKVRRPKKAEVSKPEKVEPENKYAPKKRIGADKAVKKEERVTKVGLGNLEVVHTNPINYHGNIDV